MDLTSTPTSIALWLYRIGVKLGVLDHWLGQRIFVHAYRAYKRYWEDSLEHLLCAHPSLLGSGNVFDVGANIGYSAEVLTRFVKVGSRIICFEPEPRNVEMLRQELSTELSVGRVEVVPSAVGNRTGVALLLRNDFHPGDHQILDNPTSASAQLALEVPMTTLDDFISAQLDGESVTFIKIDVQGYEFEVCQGMSRLLERQPEVSIYVEVSLDGRAAGSTNSDKVIEFFQSRNFKLFRVTRQGLSPVDASEKQPMNAFGYADVLATKQDLKIT